MDDVAAILLRRTGRLHLPPGRDPSGDGFVDLLEIELAGRGWALDPAARAGFDALPEPARTAWSDWLLATVEADTGADRPHVPLFRRFPETTPADTVGLLAERVVAFLLQDPEQPCVLCGRAGTVAPVRPCGHLVCRSCFDGTDYSACPICHRRIDTGDPFLQVTTSRFKPEPGSPLRIRVAAGRTDRRADAAELRDQLTGRAAPLSEAERNDLAVLIGTTTAPGDLTWLPGEVPARETLAFVCALALSAAPAAAVDAVRARWTTVTDIARTLWALSGNDPGLVLPERPDPDARVHPNEWWRPASEPQVTTPPPRVGPIPRPVRAAALARFGDVDLGNAVEDVLRHPTVWKRLGERLHPFERAARHPAAAVCFAALRGTPHPVGSAVGRAILSAAETGAVEAIVEGDIVRARARTFAARVEALLAKGDSQGAARLLATRPGDFLRRLDHLARTTPSGDIGPLADLASGAGAAASAAVVLSAFAALAGRDRPAPFPEHASKVARALAARHAATVEGTAPGGRLGGLLGRLLGSGTPAPGAPGPVPGQPRRVFFPRGEVMRSWSAPDGRPLLPDGAPDRLRAALAGALVARAGRLERFDVAVVDAALTDFPAPNRSRTVSPASRTIPRGTEVELPDGPVLRLFLHWTDPGETRVDLDLSVVLLDKAWRKVGLCDYTRLRDDRGAVHSGDLTSAPAPLGATEYLDLDLPRLEAAGIAHVAPVVFSYNDVPFERMTDAFAGLSVPEPGGAQFDPARVALRFDLTAPAKILLPFTVHLADRTMRWADLHLAASGYGHAAGGYLGAIGRAGEDMELAYGGGRRATLLDVAAVHAAARAREVWVRHRDAGASRVEPAVTAITARVPRINGTPLTPLEGKRVLFVAADRLPDAVDAAAPGSVLVTATSGDARANRDPADLVTEL